jgi:hypothetical protein
MNGIVRGLPGSVLAATVVAAGLAIAAPAAPAFACGEEESWARPGSSPALRQPVAADRLGSVDVNGPGTFAVPAGGATAFGVTVANRGAGIRGSIELQVSARSATRLPAMTMEVSGSRGGVTTWRRLAEEGTPGSRWYAVKGLNFQAGQSTAGFRLGVAPEAYGARLRIAARVRDAAGREVGSATGDVTVTDAALQVRTTFPGELRRGGGYREFDIQVRNPSTRAYRAVSASLTLTALGVKPNPREAGYLSAPGIRLEQLSSGSWQRLAVHPGCDPSPWATVGPPFDLAAGASRTLHLRIRLAATPGTQTLIAHYWASAAVPRNGGADASVDGTLLVRPRQIVPTTSAAPVPPESPTGVDPSPAPATQPAVPTPSATPAPPPGATRPAGLPDTGPPLWPLAAGIILVVAGGAAALVARRRRT